MFHTAKVLVLQVFTSEGTAALWATVNILSSLSFLFFSLSLSLRLISIIRLKVFELVLVASWRADKMKACFPPAVSLGTRGRLIGGNKVT